MCKLVLVHKCHGYMNDLILLLFHLFLSLHGLCFDCVYLFELQLFHGLCFDCVYSFESQPFVRIVQTRAMVKLGLMLRRVGLYVGKISCPNL